MENSRDHVAARQRMRFQQFEERSNDSCKRYNRNLPIKQEKERQENQMFQQRINRSQASKSTKGTKSDLLNKQLPSSINDLASNPASVNGAFNEQSIMLQAQKRSYAETFNGPIRDEGLVMPNKRMPDAAVCHVEDPPQYSNMRVNNTTGMVSQMKSGMAPSVSLDHLNSTIQPNVNPFLHGSCPPESAQLPRSIALNKNVVTGNLSISSPGNMIVPAVSALNKPSTGNVNLASTINLNICQTNGLISSGKHGHQAALTVADGAQDIKDIDEVLAKEGLKRIEKVPNSAHVKVEGSSPGSCDVMLHDQQVASKPTKSEPSANGYPSFEDDGLSLELAGDLHSIDQFTLFGEVAAPSPKQAKKEKSDDGVAGARADEPKNEQWPAKADDKAYLGEMSRVEAGSNRQTQQASHKQHSQQAAVSVVQPPLTQQAQMQQHQLQQHQHHQMGASQSQAQGQLVMQKPLQLARSAENMMPMSSTTSQVPIQQQGTALPLSPQNPISMSYSQSMSLSSTNSNPLTKMNQMANMQSLSVGRPLGSPLTSLQSPINSGTSPKSTMHQSPNNAMSPSLPSSSPQAIQASIPPILPPARKGSVRQQSTDLSSRQQQQQQQQQAPVMMSNMSNVPSMQGGYMASQPGQPSAAEKLQQHLQERMRRQQQQQLQQQQQQRYQLMQQMQQQQQLEMTQKQFMQQQQQQQQAASMSPMQSPMQQGQNPFQFPTDFTAYNQQKQIQGYDQMVMQSQQSAAPPGFYPPSYQVDPSTGAPMFPNNAPPEYRPPAMSRSAMLQRIMRERALASQQMSEVFPQSMMMSGARMGGMNPSVMMYGHAAKAPPQYPNSGAQGMSSSAVMEQQQQQIMMQSSVSQGMQSSSRLSHFSQPELAIAMTPQSMNLQNRMRTAIDCYPNPPSLSRSLSAPNDAMMSDAMNPLVGYGGGLSHPAMLRGSPTYSHSWSSEQQQMLLMQKQQEQQQQNLMQQRVMAQRQAQGQAGITGQGFMMLDRTQQINLNQSRIGGLVSPKNGPGGQCHFVDNTGSSTGNEGNGAMFVEHQSRTLPFSLADTNLLSPKSSRSLCLSSDPAIMSSASPGEMNMPVPSAIPADEEADLDSLLDNPPPTFDLVNLLS